MLTEKTNQIAGGDFIAVCKCDEQLIVADLSSIVALFFFPVFFRIIHCITERLKCKLKIWN